MAGRLEGKVALVTGAARGQGKSHCIRLAQEGADIIAVDILEQIDTVRYPLGSDADMADTVAQVEATGRRIVARKADVRSREQMKAAVDEGVQLLGGLHIVCANAGILPVKEHSARAFIDAMDVDFGGVLNTVAVTEPHLSAGASIILTGSTAGMMPSTLNNPALGPGSVGYGLAKTFIVQYTETLALQLAPMSIRVNAVHPTNCNTNLINNEDIYKVFRPDLENPTQDDALVAFHVFQAMPTPYVEPVDISNAVLYFASDEARFVTGINLRIDAGSLIKWPDGPKG
ncbi:MAG: mycofactocin-coupled SDR family oxidoreductase [Actinomycetota bacterium]|nr:mycofactocin-coupled SDR family oxidoreductase [Actinomycetota bacterium]